MTAPALRGLLAAGAFGIAFVGGGAAGPEPESALRHPQELHLEDVRQLTDGGENAEAYWSPDGRELIFQSQRPPYGCDQIFRMSVESPDEGPGAAMLVSTGRGRTTCAYFEAPQKGVSAGILYSSTHAAAAECPPPPDRSQGYVWPLYSSYEIYRAARDGSSPEALTRNQVYDAEATVCPMDGSIVFTSTRDGDLELYRMDADGSNVQRLTEEPGYDGGAFFSADCSKIVWRASRFQTDEELADYQSLLARGLVRPGKLELWVAEADGSNASQVTYLGAASFAPYFFPSGERVIFSTNYGNRSPREFDLWAVNVDGTHLERITFSPGFDGFPMFSPDGSRLAFASNRNQGAPGETNVFVARWVDSAGSFEARPADRYREDVAWLAADQRGGRGLGSPGLAESAHWLGRRFAELGLEGAGDDGTFFHRFEAPVAIDRGAATELSVDSRRVGPKAFAPAAFSAQGEVSAPVVVAGYGISAPEHDYDDYQGLEVEGKIVAVRRFAPAVEGIETERRFSDVRFKAFTARERGAVGLLVVDLPVPAQGGPAKRLPEEAPLPGLRVDARGDAGIPVAYLSRRAGSKLFDSKKSHRATLVVDLETRTESAENVVARVRAGISVPEPGAVLVGAHYDHLGRGGSGSLAPDSGEIHNGADDNASGTAGLLEVARLLQEHRDELPRDVVLVAFSGEESGLLGSSAFVRGPPPGVSLKGLAAMINMDMIGRLRDNRVAVLGTATAVEWPALVAAACRDAGLACTQGGDGYGPSDQMPFYSAGLPVLHLFTGTHGDYHRPGDDLEGVHAAGGAQVAELAARLAWKAAERREPLTYVTASAPPSSGDQRDYGGYLGTIPDYTDPGGEGVRLSGTRPGSPAEQAGILEGDRLVALAGREIRDLYDFVYVLRGSKPGEVGLATVLREGLRVDLQVVFGRRGGDG